MGAFRQGLNGHYFRNKEGYWNKLTDAHRNQSRIAEQWYVNNKLHREDGPAEIHYPKENSALTVRWMINGKEITSEVNEWIEENNYPKWVVNGIVLLYDPWDDAIKLHFKLTFVN